MRHLAALSVTLGLVAACNREPPAPGPLETEVPEELRQSGAMVQPVDAGLGTPMAQRVATLGLLNKRNNLTQDLTLKPGESRRVGDVVVRLEACERTAPWEMPKETGAFVQVLVRGRGENADFRRVFSGWLFKESPSLNVVEHPIYDVWVKDCAMSFPGEGPDTVAAESVRPAPAPSASPVAEASPEPEADTPGSAE